MYNGIKSCSKQCKDPCDDIWSIETTTTVTSYAVNRKEPGIHFLKFNMHFDEKTANETMNEAANVKIYFATGLVTIVTTSETTDVMTFIGNIGGQLGTAL